MNVTKKMQKATDELKNQMEDILQLKNFVKNAKENIAR